MKPPVLLFGHDELVAKWVEDKIPYMRGYGFGKCMAIGVLSAETQQPIAGFVLNRYCKQHGTIQASIASTSPLWATMGTIRELLRQGFAQENVFKLWASVHFKNEKALKCLDHIGFKREAILAHHLGKGNHAVILRMFKPEFERKYLNG